MSDLSQGLALSALSTSRDAPQKAVARTSDDSNHLTITLDQLLIPKPASTIIFPVRSEEAVEYGLAHGDLLIVDRDAAPADNQLVIISANGDLVISRFGTSAASGLPNPSNVPENDRRTLFIWGIVTYIISKQ